MEIQINCINCRYDNNTNTVRECFICTNWDRFEPSKEIVEALQKELAEVKDGIRNVINQKEATDSKWVIGYLAQLLKDGERDGNT